MNVLCVFCEWSGECGYLECVLECGLESEFECEFELEFECACECACVVSSNLATGDTEYSTARG